MNQPDSLINWFKPIKKANLLFSGGFDSSAVLGAALRAGSHITPYWIDNGFNRASEEDITVQARNLGVSQLKVIKVKSGNLVCENSQNRCYHCKRGILRHMPNTGIPILDGSTASDMGQFRPGKKALAEYGVRSPLAELGITSLQARDIALQFGADPLLANLESCLATRINYGYQLSEERLVAIRNMEAYIIEQSGDFDVRCRIDDDDHFRIELSRAESYVALANEAFRNELVKMGKGIALFVTVDMQPARPNEYDKRIVK
ncbi:exoenzyme S synthesis protein B [Marinilabiliaceae bacterium JC017]|nr:exoenzyme S synthesis protein B [Marinilabiliaceae bacterium JC017]